MSTETTTLQGLEMFANHKGNIERLSYMGGCEMPKFSNEQFDEYAGFLSATERDAVKCMVGYKTTEVMGAIPNFRDRCIEWLKKRLELSQQTAQERLDSASKLFMEMKDHIEKKNESSPVAS